MVGARLVLPGPYLDGENIYQLMDTFKVDTSAGRIINTRLLWYVHHSTLLAAVVASADS